MTTQQSSAEAARVPAVSMAMLSSLPARPFRGMEESAEGHWLRVAHSNGLADPMWLLDPGHRRWLSIVRLCPQCLARQSGYWATDWKDRSKPFCRTHGQWLVDRCSGCDSLLRWNRTRFLACKCGQDLREVVAPDLSSQTVQILNEDSASLAVLLWLGSLAQHGLTMKPLKKASRVTMSNVVELAEEGAQIVAAWPQAFFEVLSRCRQDEVASSGLRSMNDAFPSFTRRLSKLRDGPWRARIARELGAYVAASHRSEAPIVGRNVPGGRHPTVAQIARGLGMRSTTLVAALDRLPAAPIARRTTAHGRSRRLILKEAIPQVRQLRADEISIKASARLIGLSVSRIKQLVDAGLLKQHWRRLSRQEVSNLMQSLLAAGKAGTPAVDATSLRQVFRCAVPVRLTVQFVRSVLDRSLTISAPVSAKRLTDCLISQALCLRWVASFGRTDDGLLSIPVCAGMLGLKQEVAYHLVRVGLIPVHAVTTGRGRTAQMTTVASVEQFKQRYEALVHLAAQAGVDHRSAVNWAKERGIALVSGPSIDSGRQYFALRPSQRCTGRTLPARAHGDREP